MWLGQQGLKIFTFLLFQMLQVCIKLKYVKEYMKKRVSDTDNLQTQYYTNSVFNHFFFFFFQNCRSCLFHLFQAQFEAQKAGSFKARISTQHHAHCISDPHLCSYYCTS